LSFLFKPPCSGKEYLTGNNESPEENYILKNRGLLYQELVAEEISEAEAEDLTTLRRSPLRFM